MTAPFHAENDVYVGRDMGGRDVVIDADTVARYRAGTADDWSYAAGAPPLLFHSEVYRNLNWYLPNIVGNLHGGQEWELFRPLPIGRTVRTRSTVVERYRKRGRDYLVNEVLITDTDGLWLQRSRTHQSFLVEDAGDAIVVDKQREKRSDRAFVVGDCDGPDLEPLAKTITLEMCQAFSGPEVTYHTDREMARAFGFPDVVVQGMMSVCFVSELMARNFGAGWENGGKLNVKLVNVVWPDDRLHVRGRVREETPEGAKRRVHVDVWCEKDDGVKTIVGSASAVRAPTA